MLRLLKPVKIGTMVVVMFIGIIALMTELLEYEEIAKIIVIPSLILLVGLAAYQIFITYKKRIK